MAKRTRSKPGTEGLLSFDPAAAHERDEFFRSVLGVEGIEGLVSSSTGPALDELRVESDGSRPPEELRADIVRAAEMRDVQLSPESIVVTDEKIRDRPVTRLHGKALGFSVQVDQIVPSGTISSKMEQEVEPPPFEVQIAELPQTAGGLASMLRSLAETIQVSSAQHDLLQEEILERFFADHPDDSTDATRTLASLAITSGALARLRSDADELATRARSQGVSWSDIGRAAGTSPQAAHRKWDPEARKRHSDYERDRRRSEGR